MRADVGVNRGTDRPQRGNGLCGGPEGGRCGGLCMPNGTARDARKTQTMKVFRCCAEECGFYPQNYRESLEGFEQGADIKSAFLNVRSSSRVERVSEGGETQAGRQGRGCSSEPDIPRSQRVSLSRCYSCECGGAQSPRRMGSCGQHPDRDR